ncbi:MAG: transglutaminase domain-containing protein [Clostridiales bacterium]|nr:transglutaminase domain-containing protein [Clostridiales bacterium]
MIYDKYKKRIEVMMKILAFITKYKIAIISALVAVTLSVSGLLAARGTVTGASMPITEFVYGDVELNLGAKAFMSKVGYEFKADGETEWTTDVPSKPGTYTMRATAKASFGGRRTSDEFKFTIHPREVTFKVEQGATVYGEKLSMHLTDGSMAQGEVFESGEFLFEGLGTDSVTVMPDTDTIKIIRPSDNADVTECYDIQAEERDIIIFKRPVDVKFGNDEELTKVYDGTPLIPTNSDFVVTSEFGFIAGDKIEYKFENGVTNVFDKDESSVSVERVTNKDGVDVTDYYNINITKPSLRVTPREIEITSNNFNTTYCGAPIDYESAKTVSVTTGTLADGQEILPTFEDKSLINVSDSCDNDFTYQIASADGTVIYDSLNPDLETNANYSVSVVLGKITIDKYDLEITEHEHGVDQIITYDGNPHGCGIDCLGYNNDVTLANTAHRLEVTATTFVNADTHDNEFTVKIFDGNNQPVDENYNVTTVDNSVVITPRDYTFVPHSHSFTYNSTAQGCKTCGDLYGETDLSGHKIEITELAPTATDWAEYGYSNAFSDGDIKIVYDGTDVTSNYKITFDNTSNPTLIITKRAITITAHNHVGGDAFTYDGDLHGCSADDCVYTDDEKYLVEYGHTIVLKSTGEADAGTYTNHIDVNDVIIYDGETDVTANYSITTIDGAFNINRRDIIIKTHSHGGEQDDVLWTYDGEEHSCLNENCQYNDSDITSELKLVLGHKINLITAAEVTNYADSGTPNDITIEIVNEIDPTIDYTDNYNITYTPKGTLTINKREITIKTHNHGWTYDGEEHSCTNENCQYNDSDITSELKLVDDQKLKLIDSTKVVHYQDGGYVNEITVIVVDENDDTINYTDNYNITYQPKGTLTINKRLVTVKTHTHEWVYNGLAQSCLEKGCDYNDDIGTRVLGLVDNHALEIYSASYITNVFDGEVENVIEFNVFDDKGLQVYGSADDYSGYQDYTFSFSNGTLTLTPFELSIELHNHTCVYDGKAHGCGIGKHIGESGCNCCDGYFEEDLSASLVSGHKFIVVEYASITDVGSIENSAKFKIVDANDDTMYDEDDNVADNYKLTVISNGAVLTVTPRPITIKTHTHTCVYDGYYHGCAEKEHNCCTGYDQNNLTSGSLVEGDYLVIDRTTKIMLVKESEKINDLTFKIYDANGILMYDTGNVRAVDNYEVTYEYGILTITPRPVTIHGITESKIYDGTPLELPTDIKNEIDALTPLADNEYVKAIENTGDPVTNVWEESITKITENSVKIYTLSGIDPEDRTDNYDINLVDGKLTIDPRPIQINTHSHTCIYDALSHGCGIGKHSGASDVNYCNCCGVYDYSSDDLNIVKDVYYDFVSGQYLVVDGTRTTITDVGTIKNEVDFRMAYGSDVFTIDGHELIENYDLSFVYGTLEVKPRPITVYTSDGQKVFDDKDFALTEFDGEVITRIENIVSGHYFADVSIEPVRYVGDTKAENCVVDYYQIKDGNGNPINTANYEITWVNGTITITVRKIQIETHSFTCTYDGKAHGCGLTTNHDLGTCYCCGVDGYSNDDIREVDNVNYFYLADGNRLEIDTANSANLIKAGTIDNQVTFKIYSSDGTLLYSVSKADNNYEIEFYSVGKITVNKRDITVESHGHEWTYDGKDHACSVAGDCADGYPDTDVGDKVTITLSTTVKYVTDGEKDNVISVGGVKITHPTLGDVTDCYDITCVVGGTVKILPKDITVTAYSQEKEYDGTPLVQEQGAYDPISDLGVVEGDKIVSLLNNEGSIINVGTYETRITSGSVVIKDNAGVDRTANYNITEYKTGELKITPRNITINAHEHTQDNGSAFIYDGNPHGCLEDDCAYLTDIGHVIELETATEETAAGEYDNVITVKAIYDGNGNDVTGNYNVEEIVKGILEIVDPNADDDNDDDDNDDNDDDKDGEFPDGNDISKKPSTDKDGQKKVVFKVKSTTSGDLYLRLKSLGDYDLTGWKNAKAWSQSGIDVNPLYFVAQALKDAGKSPYNVVFYETDEYTGNEQYMIANYVLDNRANSLNDVFVSEIVDGKEQIKSWNGIGQYELEFYNYNGEAIEITDTDMIAAEALYSEYVYKTYLQIPAKTEQELLAIADSAGLDKNSPTIINDVAEYVRTKVSYNLEFETPYSDDIAVEFFTIATDGICQHYATAATMMFRTLGIPARYTIGYHVKVTSEVVTDVVVGNAHAWVEVYIDGLGWIRVEVTGSSNDFPDNPDTPTPTPGGEDGPEQKLGTLYVKPQDMYGSSQTYNKDNPLKPNGVIVDQEGYLDFKTLMEKSGYSYEAVVSGENYTPATVSPSKIVSLKIFCNGEDVTDKYNIHYADGELKLSEYYLKLYMGVAKRAYNGKPQSYGEDTQYQIMPESIMGDGHQIVFNKNVLPTVTITDVGTMLGEDLLNAGLITILDKDGNDVTDKYSIEFKDLLTVDKIAITVASGTYIKPYDGTPLNPKDELKLYLGTLIDGHRIVGNAVGSVLLGERENTIILTDVKIVDSQGNDVTKNYDIFLEVGTLTVFMLEE